MILVLTQMRAATVTDKRGPLMTLARSEAKANHSSKSHSLSAGRMGNGLVKVGGVIVASYQ